MNSNGLWPNGYILTKTYQNSSRKIKITFNTRPNYRTRMTEFLGLVAWSLSTRPVARGGAGVQRTTPNLPKGALFATKWAKKGVLWGGLGLKGPLFVTKWAKMGFYAGRGEVQKVHFVGFRTPLKSSLATGLLSTSVGNCIVIRD